MIDTARILLDWQCNLHCTYCCNEQERFRKDITPVNVNDIDFSAYKFFCLSGGEPLMFMDRIAQISGRIPSSAFTILYSNGILLTKTKAIALYEDNIKAINIGLHYEKSFSHIITNVSKCTEGLDMSIRFHVWDKYKDLHLDDAYPNAQFKYWALDDCDRANEDRFVLDFNSF